MPEDSLYRRVQESFARQSMMTTFGAALDEVAAGHCRIVAPILPIARQQQDAGHAALTFALGDTAAGYAALTEQPEGTEVMTAELKINLLAPAAGDRLVAIGEVLKSGRRLTVVRAEVRCETGAESTRIAVLQGTMVPVAAGA